MDMKKFYDQAFYDAQKQGSFRSAQKYFAFLWPTFAPTSVIDLGCGAGTWLKAAGDLGAKRLVGCDGPWNSQANMIDGRIAFTPVDLDGQLPIQERFDLSMSLEVAEHLKPESSGQFVKSLTALSDVVLFGAAYVGQGGTNHINERLHSDWASMFDAQGYGVFDLFRETFWNSDEVDTCYIQNAFLYVKRSSPLYGTLADKGIRELRNLAFLNCVHPVLYEVARKKGRSLRQKLCRPPGQLMQSIRKECRKVLPKALRK